MKTIPSDEHLLGELDEEDMDYVSRGLEANFDAVLHGKPGAKEFTVKLADGRPFVVPADVPLAALWNILKQFET